MPKTFTLPRPDGFLLQSAADFYAGFTPGAGLAPSSPEGLTLAMVLDRSFEPAVVRVVESHDVLSCAVYGADDVDGARAQVARMLGLDVDASAWRSLGARDGVVGALQQEFPGFFTAAKPTPYDAAVWSVLAPRLSLRHAASLKQAMARELGAKVVVDGASHAVFPAPEALVAAESFAGVPAEKIERLRGVARAALDGALDAERLRALPMDEALRRLQRLRGVGPWAASHIYVRGAAPHDALPEAEPRVLHGLAHLVGVASVTPEAFAARAAGWRPFRAWVSVLLARHLARTDGWRSPRLAAERAEAGRRVAKRTRSAQPALFSAR